MTDERYLLRPCQPIIFFSARMDDVKALDALPEARSTNKISNLKAKRTSGSPFILGNDIVH